MEDTVDRDGSVLLHNSEDDLLDAEVSDYLSEVRSIFIILP